MSMVCNVTVRQLHHHAYEVCSSTELHGHVCQRFLVAHNATAGCEKSQLPWRKERVFRMSHPDAHMCTVPNRATRRVLPRCMLLWRHALRCCNP
jgi:hypothetical protein